MNQQRFWNYYNASLDWKDQLLSKRIDGLKFDNEFIDQVINGEKSEVELITDVQSNEKCLTKKTAEQHSTGEPGTELLEPSDEINSEFLEFIVQTRKHQLERDRRKELARRKADEIDYKDIAELEARHKLVDLKEPVLCEDLYGEKANEILQKELKLQFNFNEFCDKYQPSFWPQIPINLNIKQ